MKVNLDQAKLTAYALGDLPGPEENAMNKAVAESAEAQAFVRETRELATLLQRDFRAELKCAGEKRVNILPFPEQGRFWLDARWRSISLAALLAICAVVGAVAFFGVRSSRVASRAPTSETVKKTNRGPADTFVEMEIPHAGNEGAPIGSVRAMGFENPDDESFVVAATKPASTFPIDVGTASYANVRGFINAGARPPKDVVRIEEMVNHFTYDYLPPEGNEAFSINLEVAVCPWQPHHRLARIGLKGRELAVAGRREDNVGATPDIIARDVKVRVDLNPAQVVSYRLIGYEHRASGQARATDQETGEGGEIRAGHTITALYEIVPIGKTSASLSAPAPNEMLTVKLRYQQPGVQETRTLERSLTDNSRSFEQASPDFQFAAAVAQFGMILRGSPHQRSGTIAAVIAWAQGAQGTEKAGKRAEFLELARKTEALAF